MPHTRPTVRVVPVLWALGSHGVRSGQSLLPRRRQSRVWDVTETSALPLAFTLGSRL